MNIILLSGGSGKRLWPLSNEVRSKQFLKLFKTDSGYESMIQRVYRQIKSVDRNANVLVATGNLQADIIKEQLSDKVSVCVEPCRRDTFPAIVLAGAYMEHKLGVDKEDCVIVCPIDSYVEDSFYETFGELERLVAQGMVNLALMGIEPTYPSEKYGYIIPETNSGVSRVREFREKPDVEAAKKYLVQGALWNAGVFAFRLGYLIDKAHSMIDFIDYRDLYEKYGSLIKTSFDYAVAEKEQNIWVMRYAGEWRDVGTWNMMAEVMADVTKGNVVMDDTCENSHVINELGIPIVCMGCTNMVIAASEDGILISDKERCGYMKPYVEKVGVEACASEEPWGTYAVLDTESGAITVKIHLKKGKRFICQSGHSQEKLWKILSGEGWAETNDMKKSVKAGDVVSIAAGYSHSLAADTDMDIIEIQTGLEGKN